MIRREIVNIKAPGKPDLIPGLRAALRIAQGDVRRWAGGMNIDSAYSHYHLEALVLAREIEARIAREKKARKRGR